jgi:hypothetical protein
MEIHVNDANDWRDRAAKMRAIADGYSNREIAAALHRVADDYDRLTERAEARSPRRWGLLLRKAFSSLFNPRRDFQRGVEAAGRALDPPHRLPE